MEALSDLGVMSDLASSTSAMCGCPALALHHLKPFQETQETAESSVYQFQISRGSRPGWSVCDLLFWHPGSFPLDNWLNCRGYIIQTGQLGEGAVLCKRVWVGKKNDVKK